MKRERLPKIPPILQQELRSALRAADRIGTPEYVTELLRRLRSNRVKYLAVYGVTGESKGEAIFEHLPLEHQRIIADLDQAFQRLHSFKRGGAGDYLSQATASALSSHRARGSRDAGGGRPQTVSHDEIATYLIRRDYPNSDNKKAIILDAQTHFENCEASISEKTIRTVASKYGLTRSRKMRPK